MKTSPEPDAVSGPQAVPTQSSAGFSNLDIGSPQLAGSVRPVEAGWDLIAGGADIWEKSDQFHFLYKQVSGNFDIAVRIESFTPAHLYSKAGLMIRPMPPPMGKPGSSMRFIRWRWPARSRWGPPSPRTIHRSPPWPSSATIRNQSNPWTTGVESVGAINITGHPDPLNPLDK
jgi:hypothetical protein